MRFTSLLLLSVSTIGELAAGGPAMRADVRASMLNDRASHHWLIRDIAEATASTSASNHPFSQSIQDFEYFVKSIPKVHELFIKMFQELPSNVPYWLDPVAPTSLQDFDHFLRAMDYIVTRAPPWLRAANAPIASGIPMAVLFDRIMTTKSGYEAFLRDDVNNALMRVLNQWGKYLQTPASASVLNDGPDGWLSPNAFAVMESVTNQPYNTTKSFQELFQCDPSAAHYGFSSWDDFFTRRFRPGIRPVAQGDDVIAAACESHPYNIQHDIKLSDEFYIKGQPYSVINMLDGDELSPKFAGGTVFQGLLTGASYHRWHAPVSGVIRRAKVKQGTYFSIPSFQSQCPRPSPAFDGKCIIESQAYLSSMATRAIIIIEADNKDLGLVAFIAVGMTEVSTCDIDIKQGQHVQKGDELGVFRFGGSSHCLMFQKDVKLTDWPDLNDPGDVAVRGALARVLPN